MFSFFKSRSTDLHMRKIDENFSVTGQITPEQIAAIAEAGFKSIVCARPDGEEPGQPTFNTIAQAAETAGLQVVHIPVSGGLGEGQIIRFHDAWERMPKPILGYCRSGARAGSLYATLGK